ncbi:colanic acid biosynthesis acetyltransferase WcaF [Putridiphycobacter roseus]|uniref:Colanic acid biosynthesis acetyltransferase WcaF n=1 Tax=Putridiphycobacter roseus TaxID=2219161 RepID=A0A2W1N2P9_9FLAO|nr:WcaF family extracellular polysaccharide biosynthesis acetyltransferase [Putridiphycobacter roseus]PZE17261.1 colanic acid biosynthesis acetyltransferase WcaF [Putridiphycobacter roseus]
MITDLASFKNDWYQPGNKWKILLWYFVNAFILQNKYNPSSALKVFVLKLFGAKIGHGVVIKQMVSVKYPWKLKVGNYSWIGEKVWIDNLAEVSIGNNVCISQGAMLLCGNHDYKKPTFDLMVKPIILEDGVWIGAQSTVCPGVTCKSHAVLSVQSVAINELNAYMIYQGNPAKIVRERKINEA